MTKTGAVVGGIAVVIPSYNRKHLILDALKSVADQELVPDRVILVDDGSEDGTGQVVDHWQRSTALPFDLRYIYQENSGQVPRAILVLKTLQVAAGSLSWIQTTFGKRNTCPSLLRLF